MGWDDYLFMVLLKIFVLQSLALFVSAFFLNEFGGSGDWAYLLSMLLWIFVGWYCISLLHKSQAEVPKEKLSRKLYFVFGYPLSILPVTLGGYLLMFVFALGHSGFK